jgi:hypothetical protein
MLACRGHPGRHPGRPRRGRRGPHDLPLTSPRLIQGPSARRRSRAARNRPKYRAVITHGARPLTALATRHAPVGRPASGSSIRRVGPGPPGGPCGAVDGSKTTGGQKSNVREISVSYGKTRPGTDITYPTCCKPRPSARRRRRRHEPPRASPLDVAKSRVDGNRLGARSDAFFTPPRLDHRFSRFVQPVCRELGPVGHGRFGLIRLPVTGEKRSADERSRPGFCA